MSNSINNASTNIASFIVFTTVLDVLYIPIQYPTMTILLTTRRTDDTVAAMTIVDDGDDRSIIEHKIANSSTMIEAE